MHFLFIFIIKNQSIPIFNQNHFLHQTIYKFYEHMECCTCRCLLLVMVVVVAAPQVPAVVLSAVVVVVASAVVVVGYLFLKRFLTQQVFCTCLWYALFLCNTDIHMQEVLDKRRLPIAQGHFAHSDLYILPLNFPYRSKTCKTFFYY